jgi:hypothetical protein
MTYDQLTTGSILAWPYSIRVGCLARDIWKLRQQQLEQQQQQPKKLGQPKQDDSSSSM